MSSTAYTARFPLPELIERGRDEVVKIEVYRDGAKVAPSSGTVSLYNGSNAAVVDGEVVTIVSSVAQYTIPAAVLAGETLGDSWRIEWALVMPDGVTHNMRNEAALVRGRLYMPISDVDLIRIVSGLDPTGGSAISSVSNWQDYLDEAFIQLQLRLIEQGNRPNLIMSPSALRECALSLTLALIFDDLTTRLSDAYEARAVKYREQFERAWSRLKFDYDTNDDGETDQRKRSAMVTVWV